MAAAAPSSKDEGIQTYHCLCSQFVVATTQDLRKLPRRATPAADRALILDCQPSSGLANGSDRPRLESVIRQETPIWVQREDGVEKRWPVSCCRCELTLGYHLDWTQFPEDERPKANTLTVVNEDEVQEPRTEEELGRREDIISLLPGALVTTEQMSKGERPPDDELKLQKL